MKTFTLISTHGSIVAKATNGEVVHTHLSREWPSPTPVKIDVKEWRKRYPGEKITGEHDILDFGYWVPGTPDLVYEPPCEDWRTDRDERRKRETEEAAWEAVDDNCVRTVWKCGTCDIETKATLTSINDGGIPFCAECGDDMDYQRTEIKQKENDERYEIEENKKPAEDPEFIEGPVSRATSEVSEVPRWLI